MAHYALITLNVTDPEGLKTYVAQAGAAVAKHGGKALAGGPGTQVLRAPVTPVQGVILEFPSAAAVTDWLDDPELASVHALRDTAATTTIVSLPPFGA